MISVKEIKAEIERRIEYLDNYKDNPVLGAAARELIWLKNFIESRDKEELDVAQKM